MPANNDPSYLVRTNITPKKRDRFLPVQGTSTMKIMRSLKEINANEPPRARIMAQNVEHAKSKGLTLRYRMLQDDKEYAHED